MFFEILEGRLLGEKLPWKLLIAAQNPFDIAAGGMVDLRASNPPLFDRFLGLLRPPAVQANNSAGIRQVKEIGVMIATRGDIQKLPEEAKYGEIRKQINLGRARFNSVRANERLVDAIAGFFALFQYELHTKDTLKIPVKQATGGYISHRREGMPVLLALALIALGWEPVTAVLRALDLSFIDFYGLPKGAARQAAETHLGPIRGLEVQMTPEEKLSYELLKMPFVARIRFLLDAGNKEELSMFCKFPPAKRAALLTLPPEPTEADVRHYPWHIYVVMLNEMRKALREDVLVQDRYNIAQQMLDKALELRGIRVTEAKRIEAWKKFYEDLPPSKKIGVGEF